MERNQAINEALFFLMPFIVIAFFILMFNGSPRDAMRRLFPAGVAAPVIFVFILIPGAVERLFINILRMRR